MTFQKGHTINIGNKHSLGRRWTMSDEMKARIRRDRISKGVWQTPEQVKMKAKARAFTRQKIVSGKLKKLPCEVCGNVKSQVHHMNYSKPLDVRWLCRVHHMEQHRLDKI